MAKIRFSFLICLVPSILLAHANSEPSAQKVQKDLSNIQVQMKKLEKKLFHDHREEQKLNTQLAALEKEIGERSEAQLQLQEKRLIKQTELSRLQNEEKRLYQLTSAQQQALSKLLAATYAHYHQEKLKILLSQDELPHYARANQFYQFFHVARANQIKLLQNDLLSVAQLKESILHERSLLEELDQKLKQEQTALIEKKQQRKEILHSLTQQLTSAEEALQKLQQQEQHLEQLFKTLQKSLATTPTYIDPVQDFSKMKHQLSLPVGTADAKLSFLPHLKNAKKRTYIAASSGTPVNAIFSGRVVFAEWLRGVGLLIIIDHGNGYMSLYGNNQKLYKGLGDFVNQNEMIARVGQSGGHSEPGLYFEIRKDGEALDPLPWFKSA